MNQIFNIIAAALQIISYITGLTYKEINIIVYYILIPLIYIALIDKILKRHWLKIVFCAGMFIFFLLVKNFRKFSEWLFDESVKFLLSFRRVGWDYVEASVVICVILPGLIFAFLFYTAYKHELKKLKKVDK